MLLQLEIHKQLHAKHWQDIIFEKRVEIQEGSRGVQARHNARKRHGCIFSCLCMTPNPLFEESFWGGNTLGLIPAGPPHTLGYSCTFYAPTTSPARDSKQSIA